MFLGDTMGELRKFYAIAQAVFVGRSLVAMGGSDPMEVAALGRPIVVGPHMFNFEDTTRYLVDRGAAVQVYSVHELAGQVSTLFHDAERRDLMGRAGLAMVNDGRGALDRTLEIIGRLVNTQ